MGYFHICTLLRAIVDLLQPIRNLLGDAIVLHAPNLLLSKLLLSLYFAYSRV